MRIVIDLQGAQSADSRFRGIGRYSLALATGLARLRSNHEVIVALNAALPDSIEPIRAAFNGILPQECIRVWSVPATEAASGPTEARRQAELMREAFLLSLEPDWVLVTSLFEGLSGNIVTSVGAFAQARTAVVLYDLIPWIYRETYLGDERLRSWYMGKLDELKRADLLLSISASSGREAVDWLGFEPERVANISTAAGDHFQPRNLTAAERQHLADTYGLTRPFVMYTGGIDHRKNIEGLVRAYARLPRALRIVHQLAIVCAASPADKARLLQLGATEGLAEGELVLTGFVPEDDLLRLYNACELFVFPSWHEGFGLPALEAMLCGKPVLASNRASLPEVVEREDALFDPFDIPGMTARLRQALTDPALRQSLAEHGLRQGRKFSWDLTAQRAWAALESAGLAATAAPTWATPGQRPRLAYVSPLPPEKSGIADYSSELLRDLTRFYRIDVVVQDPAAVQDDYVRAACGLRSVEQFRQQAGAYDRVLYHFGNSEFHEHMFDLLAEIPGVVVLHDFILSDVQECSQANGWRPHALTRALAASHGYAAVADRLALSGAAPRESLYAANLPVLQDALGVIVHNEFNCRLADSTYGPGTSRDWARIPLLRVFEADVQRAAARERLGIAEDTFLVCSFGLLGEAKLNHRLLEAWRRSAVARRPGTQLVYVGETSGDYGAAMRQQLRADPSVRLTGRVDAQSYRDWLAAADVAVQLRTRSRGETSAAVLDCMNRGLATIVNAHGPMAELPGDGVWLLKDDFGDEALVDALDALANDPTRRMAIGRRARAIVREKHSPRACAAQYHAAIERFYGRADRGITGLTRQLAERPEAVTPEVARMLALNHPPSPRPRQLLVDISELAHRDAKTGIQRVVRSVLGAWLTAPPEGFLVEPVYASADAAGYRYARRFTSSFIGVADAWAEDEPVEAWAGDVFVGLDLQPFVARAQEGVLQEWRRRGVQVSFVVYDVLPLLLPDYFPDWAPDAHRRWLASVAGYDSLVAISHAVADEVRTLLDGIAPPRERPLGIGWFHLGADVENSAASTGLPPDAGRKLGALRARPCLAMVGTLEPRKGHAQALAAFEALWAKGVEANFVIVGKEGWKVEELAARLRRHPQNGKRLFWLESISDEYLEQVYRACAGLLAPSEGEGFGLPLIEGARHGVAILARDLPVFREVAGDHAAYFPNSRDPRVLAQAIEQWLAAFAAGRHPKPDGIAARTWRESAAQLLEAVLHGTRCEPWMPGAKQQSAAAGSPGAAPAAPGPAPAAPALID